MKCRPWLLLCLLLPVLAPVLPAQDDEEPDFEMIEEDEPDFEMVDEDTPAPPKVREAGNFWTAWVEYRLGQRIESRTADTRDQTMNEIRGQVSANNVWRGFRMRARLDVLEDFALETTRLDVREAYVKPPTPGWLSATIGRQAVTTGLGDGIFVNDLLPKDWNSYFMGRDAEAEYMKLSSDGVRLDLFGKVGNLSVLWGARFRAYVSPHGERFAYYSPLEGRVVGHDRVLDPEHRNDWLDDDFWMVRYYKNHRGVEYNVYFNQTFWPDPVGARPTGKPYYPELRNYGAGLRSPLWKGLVSMEAGYYDSTEDPHGDNPLVRNSETRFFVGYERELARDFTWSFQYYSELRQDQEAYEATPLPNLTVWPRRYQLWTTRFTRMLLYQKLTLSLYAYYSPTMEDHYIRTNVYYKPNDKWTFHAGGNFFDGHTPDGTFAQLEENSNIFAGVRYNIR